MKLKLTKIDTNIIVVMDDEVFYRSLQGTKDPEQLYLDIQEVVDMLKSGLVTDPDEYANLKRELRIYMNPHTHKKFKDMQDASEDIDKEALDLAIGGEESVDIQDVCRLTDANENLEVDAMGCVYIKGHSVPMPRDLVNAFMDATYNPESNYTTDSLENFWKWAVLNPNGEARNDLFKWFMSGEFSITEEGMVVGYRRVDIKNQGGENAKLWEFVQSSWNKIKAWKKSPKNYIVYKGYENDELKVAREHYREAEIVLGNLDELYDELSGQNYEDETVYTDNYTKTMNIKIGEEVSMPREDCDSNRDASCSSGLHFMNKSHGGTFGSTPIVVLINPMNIVAFPHYDQTKGRTCRYLPVAIADVGEHGDILPFDEGTLDFSYAGLEKERIENLAFVAGFDTLIKDGIISDEVNIKDFGFIRETAKSVIESKVKEL